MSNHSDEFFLPPSIRQIVKEHLSKIRNPGHPSNNKRKPQFRLRFDSNILRVIYQRAAKEAARRAREMFNITVTEVQSSQVRNKCTYTESYVDSDEEDERIDQLLRKIKKKYKNVKSNASPKEQLIASTGDDVDIEITAPIIDLTVDHPEIRPAKRGSNSSKAPSGSKAMHFESNKTREGNVEKLKKGEKRKLNVILEENKERSTELAPSLGTITGISLAPKEILFNSYGRTADKSNNHRIIVGEDDAISFESNVQPQEHLKTGEYVIAIYNKYSNTVTFQGVNEADIVPVPKRLKSEQREEPKPIQDYVTAKTALDKEFGSKKVRSKISARERGQIDISQVRDLDKIAAGVEEKAKSKPANEEHKKEDSIIPPFDETTTDPSKIYNWEDIITPAELAAIDIHALLLAKTETDRIALLPYPESNYVKSRLLPSLTAKKVNHKRIRILMYINYLMAFRSHAFDNVQNRQRMAEKLRSPPNIILDKLYERFVYRAFKKIGGNQSLKFTERNEQKLICYMLVLCLILDKYHVDPVPISEDLRTTTIKLNNLFKCIGCTIQNLSKKEINELGKNVQPKRAVLNAPLKFPQPKKRSGKTR
ncbi:8363_t:CDS:2 [Funneliformis mosseae]|uniref:8363_t:CDS:1 n=1 Tax=Funneliformis mosseae TaxID=27381 RepID=A0A9N8V472_FUNMO|nr:8363_t:CDS:2 [Funneliformis mosseae]